MPDAIFADPRLVQFYDFFEGDRPDLVHHQAIVTELGAHKVLDLGCGTGTFALQLAEAGFEVTGVDPALASLEEAKLKKGSGRVRWRHGTIGDVEPEGFDVVIMTGNVAQVFVTDTDFDDVLTGCARALRPGGHLVFETRDPERRDWETWEAANPPGTTETPIGPVRHHFRITSVDLPLVRFRTDYVLPHGEEVTSMSTLRFRSRADVEDALAAAGFDVIDVRDAPDRPGKEFVFIARRR